MIDKYVTYRGEAHSRGERTRGGGIVSECEELRKKWPKLAAHMDEVVKVILHGLTVDGAHHKQHSLECVLGMLTEEEWIKKAYAELQWEKGIPS